MRTLLAVAVAFTFAAAALPHAEQAPTPGAPAPAGQDSDKDKKDAKWDVAAEFGPTSKVTFDTSEGTWMNVDVSPDGQRVVFDLLGDLYVMPIGGSTAAAPATRLTNGPAFDMQPRFSPDGKLIAFTSDRDGLFNIWVMDADGKHPKQVSSEKKWWVNSPAWAPDGDYIFARRHFVQTRSLGAGEVWMFHRSGAEGVQVTEKAGWQKDAGEPALSPDGKFLYYSKDSTPGQAFEYNKDPHAGIYTIIRRELTTGRERTIVAGAGGAITPRLSPDGKWLAFIRRIETGSQLFVRSVATGAERAIFARLDKDQQETWAVFGPYAQYAWMPDNQGLVVWGEGKIWRVDLPAAGALAPGREIPFVAKVEQTVTEAIRFPVDVAPDRFPVRMLRGAAVSPDGKSVVYSALGKLWIKTLPSGAPKRLTARDDLESDPAWSPDGKTLVYASWRDADRGRIRIIGVDGSGGREVVGVPGHYVEPSFSPEGERIVFRAVEGDDVRGPTDGEQPGIWMAHLTGGMVLIREEGTRPRFDAKGGRIFFQERRGDRTVLASVGVTTGAAPEIVHARSENAADLVPSPDGKWVAFEERWRTYVAALPQSGRPIEIGPTTKAFPVARISRDSGWNLHWSSPHTIHWTLGPDLYTRELTRTFAFVRDGVEKPDEPETAGVPIGFEQASDKPAGTIALVGARIIAMSAGPNRGVIERGTIVVEGNRITAIGPAGSVVVPAGSKRIDVAGKTIIPGLIDVHAHVRGDGDGIIAEQVWPLAANLAFGVTTSHDPSNDTQTVFTKSERQRIGDLLGPRLFSTGTILYGAETPFKAAIESYDDALMHLRRMKAVGAISVKSYNQQRRDTRQMILKAAREQGLMVVPEGGSLLYQNLTQITDGHTGVEHSLPVPKVYKDVVTLFSKTKVGYTPTLIVGYGGLFGENYWYQHDDVWKHPRLQAFTPRDTLVGRARRRPMADEDDYNHVLIARASKALKDAGTSVQLGAHGQLQGLGAHWELWMFVQGGMTPLEALDSATISGARYLGMDKDLGSLEKGKLADLVVLDRNPLENIRNSDSVRYVMLNGRLYDGATLNQIAPDAKTRPPFWWERPAAGPAPAPAARHATLPAVSPDGRRVAYLGEADGRRDIFVVDIGGGPVRRLTDTAADEGRPFWSTNGADVLVPRFADGWSTLVAIPARGGAERVVARVPGRNPQPLGARVLFSSGDWTSMQLSTSGTDGAGVQRLSDGTGAIWNAVLSPDGTRLAYTRQGDDKSLQVWTAKADGTGARLIGPIDGRVQMPAWSPDGKRLAVQVSGASGAPGPARLMVVDIDTGKATPVIADPTPHLDEVPSWFPDGRRLAFQSDRSGAWELWTVDLAGGAPRRLTPPN